MLSNDGYAVKKRKKPVQKIKPTSEVALSNPSKRHRDRLNGELERLTNLLPFPENVRCRLDKLSVLRLSVGYLKVKSFFNAAMQKNGAGSPAEHDMDTDWLNDPEFSEGELLLQSLNGFVLVVSAEGYVFYASPTIMDYLGFRQSDVIHQSVYELIHVDDRAIFCRQLHFALNPESFSGDQGEDDMQISSDITRNIVTYDPQHIPPENSSFLERSFVCRFRCLLDNSSGFLALNFQGRLKYLHGQQKRNADGTAAPPQLALFAVATPVQPPSILEIRTKTLIFQTKHKLDFTPLGIDTRGKVVLGYTEMELCMRGSGYQFIHAADMMYCADNHIRMMKTGESGLTVFRLLSKTGEWIWVQANAKLVYKGGKPDFIIARQRALANEEGEEHLRQRKLQLPFSFTTGEAVLYETNPSPDVTDFQHNDKVPTPGKDLAQNALDPDSLLGCMLKQDKSVYLNEAEPQLCADNVFMDTQALLSVPSDSWQEETLKAVDVKEESAVVAMIDTLEQMAQNRDLYTALQKLDVDSVELKEWENALLRLTREASGSEKALSLDDILTNDIISCVEDILLKDSNKCHVAPPKPSNGMKDPLAGLPTEFPANQLIPDFGLSGGQNFDCKSPAVNGLNQQELGLGSVGTPGQAVTGAPNIARGTERLSRPEHSSSGLNVPSLQQLQLKDILPPSLEIPDTSDLNGSCQNGNFSFGPSMIGSCTQAQSRNQVSMATPSASSFIQSNSYGIYHQKKMQDHPSCTVDQFMEERYGISSIQHQPNMFQNQSNNNTYLQNSLNQLDHALGNGVSNVISNNCDQNASPVQAMDFAGPQTTGEHCIPDVPNPLQNTYLQSCPSFESQINRTQGQCTQLQPDQPSPNAIQSRFTPDGFVQARKTQRISQVGPWLQTSPSCREECRNLSNGIYHSPQGGLANNQPSPLRSCMFENFSPSYTNGDNLHGSGQAVTISSCWKTRIPNNQSPPQASCYFQWSQNQPVEGTSSISQEDACISPPSFPGISSPETVMEQYLGCNGQTHITSHPMALHGAFSSPLVNKMYFPEGSQASCFNA